MFKRMRQGKARADYQMAMMRELVKRGDVYVDREYIEDFQEYYDSEIWRRFSAWHSRDLYSRLLVDHEVVFEYNPRPKSDVNMEVFDV